MSLSKDYELITGGISKDTRGQIRYVNDFDMAPVKRFYIIKNKDVELIRGWRGHRIEQRWFYALSGTFVIYLIHIDNWEEASRDLPIGKIVLYAEKHNMLHIPNGYATAIKALVPNSELLIYADYDLTHAVNDDYTWALSYFEKI